MERVLVLDNRRFPEDFDNVKIESDNKREVVSSKLVARINEYNDKLNITGIEYYDLTSIFEKFYSTKYTGAIIEREEISFIDIQRYEKFGYMIQMSGSKVTALKIIEYVFISQADEDSRNNFVSQTIFPTAIDYMHEFIDSPDYSIANHPIMFINILNKKITAKMILRHLTGLVLMGIDYVEVFPESINVEDIPKTLRGYLEMYLSDFSSCHDHKNSLISTDNYTVDYKNKRCIVTTKNIKSKVVKSGSYYGFNGSSEKFFWIEVIPICMFAYDQGYLVDLNEYELFCKECEVKFNPTSEKLSRSLYLLDYLKKYTKQRRY